MSEVCSAPGPTTPDVKQQLDPFLFSTPLAQGTASRSEFTNDSLASSPRNIELVEQDLKSTITTHVVPFLKAILARMLLQANGNVLEEDTELLKRILTERDTIFDTMLKDAVHFCNNKESKRWKDMEKELKDYCKQKDEKERYLPLSNILNSILIEFRSEEYGSLPEPSEQEENEQVIFIPNDPVVIKSPHLWEESYRKPDVVGVPLSFLCEVYENFRELDHEEMSKKISEKLLKRKEATRNPTWSDINLTLELKLKQELEFLDRTWKADEILQSANPRATVNGVKRAYEECNPVNSGTTSKRSRTTTQNVHVSIVPEGDAREDIPPSISHAIQCAYYALERLSAKWTIMHSIVILLTDASLSLRWYDAQGCIESEPFDILEQLPILIVMVMIFQRFTPYMWGVSQSDASEIEIGGQIYHLGDAATKFELKGRRTAGAFAEPELCPDGSSETSAEKERRFHEDNMSLFFKSSWAERARVKEPTIITTVDDRSNDLLPVEFFSMVTDHIPTIIASHECSSETTGTIRFFLDEAMGSSKAVKRRNQERARVRMWMITSRLKSLHTLTVPSDFWRAYWDIMRCHYLLWKMGIAHGDISLTNLMYNVRKGQVVGILNDFDLAAIMKPGDRFPARSGWERTGTIAFMAVDLLSHNDGKLQRWYRHDLESFAWCLLWEMFDIPPREWLYYGIKTVEEKKTAFIFSFEKYTGRFKHDWAFFSNFMIKWVWTLRYHSQELSNKITFALLNNNNLKAPDSFKLQVRNADDLERTESYHIKLLVEEAKKVKCSTNVPALEDISWIDVVLVPPPT